jgi:hypothetical protein
MIVGTILLSESGYSFLEIHQVMLDLLSEENVGKIRGSELFVAKG